MAKQVINIGATPNDGTGDPLRDAFNKTNGNFDELYALIPQYQYLTANYTLPDSTNFVGTIFLVNVGTTNLTISTEPADKLNGQDDTVIYPDESFQIVKESTNKYRIV